MTIKLFHHMSRNSAVLGILGLSLFSFAASGITSSAAGTVQTVNDSKTAYNSEPEDADMIVIDDLRFRLSTASPETLAAYNAYQEALAYQNEWNMMLVNKDHPLDENYTFTQKTLPGYSMTIDERVYEPLLTMLDAGTQEGCRFVICSAYRSFARQTQIYNSHISNYRSWGYSYEKAKELTELSIAVPGSSEHQTGMAVDIVATYYQQLNDNFANTKEAQWLKEHAHEYGFILRYPKDKTDITQITFEPWHFRYVGKEAALEVYELGVCYEEYIAMKEQAASEALDNLRAQVAADYELALAYARKYNPQGSWYSDDYGTRFLYTDNTFPYRAWIQFGDNWHYFLPDGYMAVGWLKLGDNWYYFNEAENSGEMITGWFQDTASEKWYYFNETDHSGEMLTGWFLEEEDGNWYYLSEDGSLLTSAFTPDGCYVDEKGAWVQDAKQIPSVSSSNPEDTAH